MASEHSLLSARLRFSTVEARARGLGSLEQPSVKLAFSSYSYVLRGRSLEVLLPYSPVSNNLWSQTLQSINENVNVLLNSRRLETTMVCLLLKKCYATPCPVL